MIMKMTFLARFGVLVVEVGNPGAVAAGSAQTWVPMSLSEG